MDMFTSRRAARALSNGPSCSHATATCAARLPIAAMRYLLLAGTAVAGTAGAATAPFINEFHYDNAGADVDEGVEILAVAGTDLGAYTLYFYNGSNGENYASEALDGIVADQLNGFGTRYFLTPGLQNGPDGIALVGPGAQVMEFISYEGSFQAVDGPAAGLASIDVGVSEGTGTPVGSSLQRQGSGTLAEDFLWGGPAPASPGAINDGQLLLAPIPAPPALPLLASAMTLLAGRRYRRAAACARRHGAQARRGRLSSQRSSCQPSHNSSSGSSTVSSRKLAVSATT
jgi:hypothetical protein